MLHLAAFALASSVQVPPPLPVTGLAPAKLIDNLCVYRYPISTQSEPCQRLCDQGFGYYYSYVWMEAARSFETALTHDPDCPVAWLGLHKALEKWGKTVAPKPDPLLSLAGGAAAGKLVGRYAVPPHTFALEQAKRLLPKASHRESLLVTARLQEKGMLPGVASDERRRKAQQTLDELLSLYPDDQEGWFARAQVADGTNGAAPFFHALLRVNPLHPGANHEFVHYYENVRRPALGWAAAEAYMASSPKIPHAFHMQAHLATRIGKWQYTSDWSYRAVELEEEYHRVQGVKPADDHQFQHHLETLTRSLVHDGRLAEAKVIKRKAEGYGYAFHPEWFRLAVTERDWAAADAVVAAVRKKDRTAGAYFAGVLAAEQGDAGKLAAEADVLAQAQQAKRGGRQQELRLWEVQGRLGCRTGDPAGGLKLLRRTIDKTKDDYSHHAWGGGAYFMEVWGVAALHAGDRAEAEEAFQESLAHDPGSVRGALGLWAVCDRLGRADEAARFLSLARRCWAKADPALFERLRDDFLAASAMLVQ